METRGLFMITTSWLPPLIRFTTFGKDMPLYIEAIYAQFKNDFINTKPVFRGTHLGLKRYPLQNGKEATFWHMITEGEQEKNRTIAINRCERIGWPAPIINHSEEQVIRCWENRRKSEIRILLWLVQDNYLVVLTKRSGYILPWTAYPLTQEHTKMKLEKEYQDYKKARGAPQ